MRPADKPGAVLARLRWDRASKETRLAEGARLAEARRAARELRGGSALPVSREEAPPVSRERVLPVSREAATVEADAGSIMGHPKGCPCGLCHYGREWLKKKQRG